MIQSAEWANKVKQTIHVTLVGIDPSDQVQIKGYLRILLRVDFDIEWVSPKNPKVDLFLVNHAFSNSSSVISLIRQSQSPVLFIAHNPHKNNVIENNTLYLKLEHISILDEWLQNNVTCVYEASHKAKLAQANTENPSLGSSIKSDDVTQINESTPKKSLNKNAVALLNTLNDPYSDSYYEVIDNGVVVAIARPRERLIWPKGDSFFPNFSLNWSLKEINNPGLAVRNSMNMSNWLWICALEDDKNEIVKILPLNAKLMLRTWPKPRPNENKSDYLRILAFLETRAFSVNEIANKTNISINKIHSCMASLYMAGYVDTGDFEYDSFIKNQVAEPAHVNTNQVVQQAPIEELAVIEPNQSQSTKKEVVTEKKMGGFLSRIRATLGF